MKKIIYTLLILLFSSLTSFQSYAVDRSCAEALGLGQELRAFYAQRDVLLRDPSPENVNQVALLYNNLWDKADTVRNTYLHLAASKNDIPAIRYLVSNGIPVDVWGQTGATPLGVASASAHIQAIDVLLELGADINAPDAVGNSPLFYGVVSGQTHIVEHLLRKGADINQANLVDVTPIIAAVRHELQDIFRILASHGANLMSTNINGWTLLHETVIDPAVTDRVGMVETILDTVIDWPEPGIINWPEPVGGASPLHWAAYYGHTDVIEILLQRGASLTSTNKDGELPIHVAARADQKDAFLKLRDANLELLKAVDNESQTPIETARKHNSQNVLSALGL